MSTVYCSEWIQTFLLHNYFLIHEQMARWMDGSHSLSYPMILIVWILIWYPNPPLGIIRNFLSPSKSLEKAMAPHSSTLAWKIPWTEEPDRLQSMGLLRVEHDWMTSLWLFTFMHWRRIWQPTPVFLPGESQGWGSLVGCRLWDRIESDTNEVTYQQQQQ